MTANEIFLAIWTCVCAVLIWIATRKPKEPRE